MYRVAFRSSLLASLPKRGSQDVLFNMQFEYNCAEGTVLRADYVRLMKYGDSLYRCKELKRAALVRPCSSDRTL